MDRVARAAAGIVAGCLAVAAAASAQSEYIAEDEVQTYLVLLGQNLGQCDVGWFQHQFLPSSRIRFVYPDKRRQTFTPPQYVQYLQTHCNPLAFEKRQLSSSQISDTLDGGKQVRWTFWWGQRRGAAVSGPSTAMIELENEAVLVKHGERLYMTQLMWRVRELVPGAAKTYFGEALMPVDEAHGVVQRALSALSRWNQQILDWVHGLFRRPQPQTNGWN